MAANPTRVRTTVDTTCPVHTVPREMLMPRNRLMIPSVMSEFTRDSGGAHPITEDQHDHAGRNTSPARSAQSRPEPAPRHRAPRPAEPKPNMPTGNLPLELLRSALRDKLSLIEHSNPISELTSLLKVLSGEKNGHPISHQLPNEDQSAPTTPQQKPTRSPPKMLQIRHQQRIPNAGQQVIHRSKLPSTPTAARTAQTPKSTPPAQLHRDKPSATGKQQQPHRP